MKMRKLISLVLALVMVFGLAAPVMAAEESVQETAGGRLLSLGVIEGYTDGTLGLDKTITRAEIAVVLARIAGMGEAADLLKDTPSKFSDVKTGEWYTGWINLASSQGWVVGDPQGTFRPNDSISYREIVTVLLKVLGYDDNLPGDWPTNFLAKAASLGITKGIVSDSKAPAVRGDVFVMTSRTLDEETVKYDKDTGRFDGTGESLLVAKMNLEKAEGVVTSIPRVGKKGYITIKGEGSFKVVGNVDYEAIFGCDVTAWLNDDDEVVFVDIDSDDVYFDAIEWNASKEELKLVDAGDKYDLAKNVLVYINGVEKDFGSSDADYDYAKVVLNDDGDVVFVDAWTWDDHLVVEKVDDEVIYSYGEELDTEDFTIVKDGATISIEDVAEGDIVFFNEKGEFAEVFNSSKSGKLQEVYTDEFRFEGKDYDIAGKYINEDGDIKPLTATALEQMLDEGEEITVFFKRNGDVAFVAGELGVAPDTEVVGLLVKDATIFTDRRGDIITIDVITENGERVDYDVKANTLAEDFGGEDNTVGKAEAASKLKAGKGGNAVLLEITIDSDGEITKVKKLDTINTTSDPNDVVKTSDKYIGNDRLRPTTVLFITEDWTAPGYDKKDNYVTVVKLGDADFDEMQTLYYAKDNKGNITYIVVDKTDRESDMKEYTAIVLASNLVQGETNKYRVRLLIDNEEVTVYTSGSTTVKDVSGDSQTFADIARNQVAYVKINEANGTLVEFVEKAGTEITVKSRSVQDGTITDTNDDVYTLVKDAYIYDWTGTNIDKDNISLRDITPGDKVLVFTELKTSNKFAKYVLLKEEGELGPVVTAPTISNLKVNDTDVVGDVFTINVFNNPTSSVDVSVTFNVAASSGRDISEVKVNGNDVTPVSGACTYSNSLNLTGQTFPFETPVEIFVKDSANETTTVTITIRFINVPQL